MCEANCCKHVRAWTCVCEGRTGLRKAACKNMFSFEGKPKTRRHDAVKLFIIKRERNLVITITHIEQISSRRGLACRLGHFQLLRDRQQFHHTKRTVADTANRTDTARLKAIYNVCNNRGVLNAPASRIIIEQYPRQQQQQQLRTGNCC